jgi:preprotein translocase subunit SecE
VLGVRIPPGLQLFRKAIETNMLNKINIFITDVIQELKKVSWPTFEELRSSTIVVIVVSIIFAVFIFSVDRLLSLVMQKFLQ